MEKKIAAIIKLTFLNLILISSIFANDMELYIEKGISVILHSDHSWSYRTADTPELSDDTSIMLDNGKIIQIKRNHTWFYVDAKQQRSIEKQTEKTYIGSVYSVGKARGNDLVQTKRSAMDQAYKQLAKQLIATLKTKNLTIENLVVCMENEGKDVTINDQVKNGIWRVEVKITIVEEQIQRVIDCAMP
jgi:hypothetical protein